MFLRTWYIYHSGCLKGWPFLSFYFLPIICIYTCLSLGHCYKQIWYFTPLFSSVVVSLGFGLVIRMFFWWRGGPTLLCFAVVGLCVDAVVTVHFDFNRIRLERLFSIFLLQRKLPAGERRNRNTPRWRWVSLRAHFTAGQLQKHTIRVNRHRLQSDHLEDVCMKQANTVNASSIQTELLSQESTGLMVFSTKCVLSCFRAHQ